MSRFLLPAQQAIFAELEGAVDANVYDEMPYVEEGKPDEDFPYIAIGNDTFAPFDTDDTIGGNVTVTLHMFSRAPGSMEIKEIMADVDLLLNRSKLAASSAVVVDCTCEFSDSWTEKDGRTRHGVQRYRLTMQEC